MEGVIIWVMANPLPCVGVLAGVSALVAWRLVPRSHTLRPHDHPRC